jgi:hypothetical protein
MAEYQFQPSPTRTGDRLHSDVPGYGYKLWLPECRAGGAIATHFARTGLYVKNGNLVHAWYYVALSTKPAGGGANVEIHGLPYTIANRAYGDTDGNGPLNSLWALVNPVQWEGTLTSYLGMITQFGADGGRYFIFKGITAAGTSGYNAAILDTNIDNTAVFRGCFIYPTDQ